MGQLSEAVQGEKGTIPGNTHSAEHVKGIEMRSGRLTEDPTHIASPRKPRADRHIDGADRHERGNRYKADANRHEKEVDVSSLQRRTEIKEHGPATFLDTQLLTKIERVRQYDEQYSKFVEIRKKLYINVPFLDAIQVPTYARHMLGM